VVDRLDVDVVVDSSKTLSWIIDSDRWARRSGLETALVLSWKRPHDLAASFYKRSQTAESIEAAMRSFLFNYRTALALDIPKVAIRNDRLRNSPEVTTRALCQSLGLRPEPGQHEFWRFDHHHLFGSSSASAQVTQSRPIAEDSPSEEFEAAWSRLDPGLRAAADSVADDLSRLDVEKVTEPVAARVGSVTRTGLGEAYVKQRLLTASQTASLHVRMRRLRRNAPDRVAAWPGMEEDLRS
jgi:hypothetical protein